MKYSPEEMRKAWYFQGVLEYVAAEYDVDNMPEYLSEEMNDYLEECYSSLRCYPNAAGKFYEMFRNTSEKS